MKITGSFPVTAQVDKKGRRIIGLIVPFGEVGHAGSNGDPIDVIVEAGGLLWDDPNQVKLVIDHNGDKPIMAGKARDLIETSEGIVGTFSVVPTIWGDQALVEAAEGLRLGLSVEAETEHPPEDGTLRLTASTPGRLNKVALVETPAFTSARVHEVAAKNAEPTTDVNAAEVPDDQLAELQAQVAALSQTVAGIVPADQEEDTMQPDTPAEASKPAVVPAVASHLTASTLVTREPFVYGHPGAEGKSLFADLWAAKGGEASAVQRVDKARTQVEAVAKRIETLGLQRITAADEAAVMTDVTIPNVYQDGLFLNLPSFPRDIADNIPDTPITSARPILVPVVDGFVADGGSGEPVTAHTENTNPNSAEIDVDYDTYTPVPYSGKIDAAREMVDAGSPGMDELLFGLLRRSYNHVTEAAAYTAIAGYSGIDTASSTTDASATVEAQNMVSTIISEMAAFKGRAGYPADIVWSNPTEFARMTGLNASDGRPILPYTGPMNAVGQGVQANYDAVPIQGRPMINATYVASTKVLLAARNALHKWESPTLQWEWPEPAGPAKIRFVLFGYMLTSVIDARGVCLITQA